MQLSEKQIRKIIRESLLKEVSLLPLLLSVFTGCQGQEYKMNHVTSDNLKNMKYPECGTKIQLQYFKEDFSEGPIPFTDFKGAYSNMEGVDLENRSGQISKTGLGADRKDANVLYVFFKSVPYLPNYWEGIGDDFLRYMAAREDDYSDGSSGDPLYVRDVGFFHPIFKDKNEDKFVCFSWSHWCHCMIDEYPDEFPIESGYYNINQEKETIEIKANSWPQQSVANKDWVYNTYRPTSGLNSEDAGCRKQWEEFIEKTPLLDPEKAADAD